MLSILLAVLLSLDRDDYVHPQLSPDGKKLAVARVLARKDGTETTDVLLFDVENGRSKELISRKEAEQHEVYESYVYDIDWLSNDRVAVHISDGDVGGVTLTVDAKTRRVIATEIHEEDTFIPAEYNDVARNESRYAAEFSHDELMSALGSGATRLAGGEVVVQRALRRGKDVAIFRLGETARLVATVPREEELGPAIEHGGRLLFALDTGSRMRIVDSELRTLGSWPVEREEAAQFRAAGSTLYLLIRPHRDDDAGGRIFELVGDTFQPRDFGENLNDVSFSADGNRVAIHYRKNGRRAVRVLEGHRR